MAAQPAVIMPQLQFASFNQVPSTVVSPHCPCILVVVIFSSLIVSTIIGFELRCLCTLVRVIWCLLAMRGEEILTWNFSPALSPFGV